jgi:peptide/nickel transport system substrate-binding protein
MLVFKANKGVNYMKKKNRLVFILACMLIISFLLSSCGNNNKAADTKSNADTKKEDQASETKKDSNASSEGKVLKIGTPYTIDTFNPYLTTSDGDRYVIANIYETLISSDGGKLYPCLAESWEIADDNITYTLKIRDNAYWQTGNELFGDEKIKLTAQSIADAFNFVMDENNKSYHYADAVKYFKSFEATDDTTLIVTSNFPSALILKELSDVLIFPVEAMEKGYDLAKFPVGSGPYKFVEYRTDDKVILEKNTDYYISPGLDKVEFQIIPDKAVAAISLQNNEIDIVPQLLNTDLEAVASRDDLMLVPNSVGWYRYIGINCSKPIFQDIKVRQAISLAIDFEGIVSSIFDNDFGAMLAVNSYGGAVPLEFEGSNVEEWKKHYEYNPEKAAALLEEAGWKKGSDSIFEKDGQKLKFAIKTPTSDQNRMKMGDMAATFLKTIGIDAASQPTEWATMLEDIKSGNTELFIMGGGSTVGGLNMLFHSVLSSTGSHNVFYNDPELDKMLDDAYSNVDTDERIKQLEEAALRALENRVHAGGYFEYVQIGMNKKVKDFDKAPTLWYGLAGPTRNVTVE